MPAAPSSLGPCPCEEPLLPATAVHPRPALTFALNLCRPRPTPPAPPPPPPPPPQNHSGNAATRTDAAGGTAVTRHITGTTRHGKARASYRRAPRIVLVNVLRRAGGGVAAHGPELGVGQRLLLAQATQVDLAPAAHVVAFGAADEASLGVPATLIGLGRISIQISIQMSDQKEAWPLLQPAPVILEHRCVLTLTRWSTELRERGETMAP
jgi:hypothetical protein